MSTYPVYLHIARGLQFIFVIPFLSLMLHAKARTQFIWVSVNGPVAWCSITGFLCVFSLAALTFMHIKDVYPAKAWQAVFIDAANVLTFVIALALIVKTPKDTHDEWATRFLEGDNASIDYKAKAEWYSCGGLAGLEIVLFLGTAFMVWRVASRK